MHLGTEHQAAEGEFDQEGGAEFPLRTHTHTHTQVTMYRSESVYQSQQVCRQVTDQRKLFREARGDFGPAEENVET